MPRKCDGAASALVSVKFRQLNTYLFAQPSSRPAVFGLDFHWFLVTEEQELLSRESAASLVIPCRVSSTWAARSSFETGQELPSYLVFDLLLYAQLQPAHKKEGVGGSFQGVPPSRVSCHSQCPNKLPAHLSS